MPEDFSFSPILRHEERDSFLNSEELVRQELNKNLESSIRFEDRKGVLLVKVITFNGKVIEDILCKDHIDYNYCIGLIKQALGVNEDD